MSRAPSKTDAWKAGDDAPTYSLAQLDRMDRKFVAALLTAIAAGREHAPIGVCTTPGTRNPVTASRLLELAIRSEGGKP